jgi:hypothetical protein
VLCYAPTETHTIDEIRNSFMVSYGNTQVPYTPYVSTSYPVNLGSLELCKIGDYQDYLYKDLVSNKWYKYEVIRKVVLNGSESGWTKTSYTFLNDKIYTGKPTSICSSYTNAGTSWSSGNVSFRGKYTTTNTSNILKCMPLTDMTLEDFKTSLSLNNVILYYVLETPTSIEITDTTLIEQLDAIYNAQSYDYQTNITQTNAVLPFIITATARVERS